MVILLSPPSHSPGLLPSEIMKVQWRCWAPGSILSTLPERLQRFKSAYCIQTVRQSHNVNSWHFSSWARGQT